MKVLGGQSWVPKVAKAALVLLASLAFFPAQAHASCGDYVHLGTHRADGAMPADPLAAHSSDAPRPAHAPCSGPNCSRLPLAPPPAPLPQAPTGGSEWGVLTTWQCLLDFEHESSLRQDCPLTPVYIITFIYHPPRYPLSSSA
jgi:hypothetical protein